MARKTLKARKATNGKAHSDQYASGPITDTMRVKLLVKDNPKRGASAKRFAKLLRCNGKTVEHVREQGVTLADLRWDKAHKFISLSAG